MGLRPDPGESSLRLPLHGYAPDDTLDTDSLHDSGLGPRERADLEVRIEVAIETDAEISRHDRLLPWMRTSYAEKPLRSGRPDSERRISVKGAEPAVHYKAFPREIRTGVAGNIGRFWPC